jgi:hypothetical protein
MLSFKEFILAEELGQTQRVFLGGKARAEKNDNLIRYLPTANQPGHKFSDEQLPDEYIPWILKMAQKGHSALGISKKLYQLRKIKASPEMIAAKIGVARTRGDVIPTFRVGDVSQAPKPEYDRYHLSPEAKEAILRYRQMKLPAALIQKKLKQQGMDVSYTFLMKFLHELPPDA